MRRKRPLLFIIAVNNWKFVWKIVLFGKRVRVWILRPPDNRGWRGAVIRVVPICRPFHIGNCYHRLYQGNALSFSRKLFLGFNWSYRNRITHHYTFYICTWPQYHKNCFILIWLFYKQLSWMLERKWSKLECWISATYPVAESVISL